MRIDSPQITYLILEELPHLLSLIIIELLNPHQSRAFILFAHSQFVRRIRSAGRNGMKLAVLRE